jgi:NAD-dependent dihydropyrimidine dehydrogenase PreA subunit
VNEDYCKSCGICIACRPHDVIEPAARSFDMGEARRRSFHWIPNRSSLQAKV